jgi:phosphoglucosamine mutase
MKTNIFGTDGIRAHCTSDLFTPMHLEQLGNAIGAWACKKKSHPTFIIGYDTRLSSPELFAHLAQGLLKHPVTLYNAQYLPTPVVCALTKYKTEFDFGLIISASHNTYEYNGIKLCTKNSKIDLLDEEEISTLFYTHPYTKIQHGHVYAYTEALDWYIQTVQAFFPQDCAKNLKIVVDCAHGANYCLAPLVFTHFGATIIPLNITPSGKNINEKCGALHPELIQEAVIKHNADLGFAFDGDGDRVIMVDRAGRVHDGDDIIHLLLQHPVYVEEKTVVGTIMSNQGLEVYVKSLHKKFYRTPVGDKHIAHYLQKYNLKLGAEPSGHVICNDFSFASDAIFVALRLIEAMHVQTIKTHLEKYPQANYNITIKEKKDLLCSPFKEIIATFQEKINPGRLIVRYSGTEPVLRVTSECKTQEQAESSIQELITALSDYL